jgi:3-methyladenine DNA glycosylase AlkD
MRTTRSSGRTASTPSLSTARQLLRQLASPGRARLLQRYFRTGPGQYGEGDRFLGLTVPEIRRLARAHQALTMEAIRKLLRSPWHEERLLALLIMGKRFDKAAPADQRQIYRLYLHERRYVNNWDLVDQSAARIVGAYLHARPGNELFRLARSRVLWDRRIAMIATMHDIRHGRYDRALQIATILVADRHDLIHKAVGWMLREIGNRDRAVEERFLQVHAATMPRTMLRYAIERFPEPLRREYLSAGDTMRGR